MKIIHLFACIFLFLSVFNVNAQSKNSDAVDSPISLHPENPHYFKYKGKTTLLITSAEHYGAVLNLDFDYKKYLETLHGCGLNYTRIFTGIYSEIEGVSFNISMNTLAPKTGRLITPWKTVYKDNMIKYDLSQWNSEYFTRLKDFMSIAASYDIIVEVTLFSSMYKMAHWNISPQNPNNNINVVGNITRFEAQTLNNGELLKYQELYVQKFVNELNEFNNFFFEIQNEPWSDHDVAVYNIINQEKLDKRDFTYKVDLADEESIKWQDRIISVIKSTEKKLQNKHLIAQNYANYKAPVPTVNKDVSIINFHYAWPEAVSWNYHYNKVIGFDESGFAGSDDMTYRRQAWRFLMSGGALFNNLDYSFAVGFENGLARNKAPGGGSEKLREQLKYLLDFMYSFNLVDMSPDQNCIASSPGLIPYVLSDKKKNYAVYLRAVGTKQATLKMNVPNGKYTIQAFHTKTGQYIDSKNIKAIGKELIFDIEIPENELALKIKRD